jgi:3-oxoacyl-[acyl-carrier protein] reductase
MGINSDSKVTLVTGGARGIGRATAERFVKGGHVVFVADRDEVAAQQTARELGHETMALGLDVADKASVDKVIGAIMERCGRIDVLVNNAGITRDATLAKMDDEAWEQVIDVNLTGTFYVTRAVARHMVEKKKGVILNAASVVGLYGNFGQSNYVASKAGVIGMTRVWARELGRKGVRVNCIAPGFIETDMTRKMPEEVLSTMKGKTPVGRLGQPADVAEAYWFLASEQASFINGQVLGVDGGLVLGT